MCRYRPGRPLPLADVPPFSETGDCHQLIYENHHPDHNMLILVGAPAMGLK